MGLDADHRSLCNIDISEPSYADLCDYISKALQAARQQIATGSPECKLRPLDTEAELLTRERQGAYNTGFFNYSGRQ